MSAHIEVADPKGKLAKWLDLKPGPLRGNEKLTVEVEGSPKQIQKLAEDLAEIAGADEVSVTWT